MFIDFREMKWKSTNFKKEWTIPFIFYIFFFFFFVGWLDAIYNDIIIKLLQMDYNSIHLEVEVFQRV